MSYNRKLLSQMIGESKQKRTQPKPKDRIVDPMGQWAHPGEITVIPGDSMATHGYGNIPLYVEANNGFKGVIPPNSGNIRFPGATQFTEYPLPQAQKGGTIPVVDDMGNYNEEGVWIPDWQGLAKQAKKLGSKVVKTTSGSIIEFDDNWKPKMADDNPLVKAQDGAIVDPHQDFLKNWYTNRVITDPYIQEGFDLDKPAYLKNLQSFPEYTYVDNIDNDPYITGRYEGDTGKLLLTSNAPEHVKTHELNHFLNRANEAGGYMRTVHGDIVRNELRSQSELAGPYKDKYEYFSDPDEVHSRIMVLREKAGFKPNETITPEKIQNFLKTYEGDNDNINDLLELSKGEEGLLNMLNFMAKNNRGQKLTKAQNGLTYLEPTSRKLPTNNDRSELATSIGGENGEPAFLVPSFKYGQPILGPSNDPYLEFLRTREHLGGPFKTWQEADEWDRNVRHPYVEKGQSIPTPIRRWGKDYTNQSSAELPYKFYQNGGPIVVPYNREYTDREYQDYNKFYEDFYRPPYLRKDDRFDKYFHKKLNELPGTPTYSSDWERKNIAEGNITYYDRQPKPKAGFVDRKMDNELIGYDPNEKDPSKKAEISRVVKAFAEYKPSTVLGFRNGGDISIPNLEEGSWLDRYEGGGQLQQFAPGGFATTFTTTLKPTANQQLQYLNYWSNQSKSNNQNGSILNRPQQTSTGIMTTDDLYRAAGINFNQKPQIVLQAGYVADTSKQGAVQLNKTIKADKNKVQYVTDKKQGYKQQIADQEKRKKEEEKRQIKEREAAAATRAKVIGGDDNATFTFPNGQTKVWKDMDWREQAYVSGKNLGSWNNNNWTDWINPLAMLGSLSEGLGTSPYVARETNSYIPYATGVGAPLLTGALAGIGANTTSQFANNLVNPLAGLENVAKNVVKQTGEYLTQGPLKNAWKLNPIANKLGQYNRVVGQDAILDLQQSGLVRSGTGAPTTIGRISVSRPTAYPSFAKGAPRQTYLNQVQETGQTPFIISTDRSMGVSTLGRHGKGTTQFPIDESGNYLTSFPASEARVYEGTPHWLRGYKPVSRSIARNTDDGSKSLFSNVTSNTSSTKPFVFNQGRFDEAKGFLDRYQHLRKLQAEGFIAKDADILKYARSGEGVDDITRRAIERANTRYRGVYPDLNRYAGAGQQYGMGVKINDDAVRLTTEAMRNAGVDITDPVAVGEYMATHIPLKRFGYRSGINNYSMPRNWDVLFTSTNPSTMYGSHSYEMKIPFDFEQGNYKDWYNTFIKNKQKKAIDELAYNSRGMTIEDYVNGKPFSYQSELYPGIQYFSSNNNTFAGPAGSRIFNSGRLLSAEEVKNLSGKIPLPKKLGGQTNWLENYN